MKKTISLVLVILLLFSLSSCVIKTDKAIELCGYVTDITSIDIYFTDEEYSKPIDTIREDSTPLYAIKKEDEGAFIDRILSLEYEKDVVFLPITYAHVYSNGYIIVINYSSGNFDLIGDTIERQFKYPSTYHVGAAISLVMMILILISMAIMNRFSDDEGTVIV